MGLLGYTGLSWSIWVDDLFLMIFELLERCVSWPLTQIQVGNCEYFLTLFCLFFLITCNPASIWWCFMLVVMLYACRTCQDVRAWAWFWEWIERRNLADALYMNSYGYIFLLDAHWCSGELFVLVFNGISMFTTSSGQPMLLSNQHQYFVADVPQVTITLNIRDMDAYLVSIALVVLQAQCNIISEHPRPNHRNHEPITEWFLWGSPLLRLSPAIQRLQERGYQWFRKIVAPFWRFISLFNG